MKGNHLVHESSPYLLQHAYNPVDWYPWGDEALAKAKKENKLILVSIGYAACHWCHVMEHESFEDSAVAKTMNDHFVSIKVDREERPDIDDVYMTACQMSNGRGCGWPLNAFALPDGRPVWAGTYFPKDRWMSILEQFRDMKDKEPEKLEEYASKLTQGIKNLDVIEGEAQSEFKREDLIEMAKDFVGTMDMKRGGRKGAPKFPMPSGQLFLLKAGHSIDKEALDAVEITLDNLARGGIYDQLGGGFARYSTDEKWFAPHFEKMLYDNGQLISAFAEANRLNPKPFYKTIVDETIEFVQRELMSPEYGFYSSLDADSEGEEGKFYVWTKDEIDMALEDEAMSELFCDFYNVKSSGNWEKGHNILYIDKPLSDVAAKNKMSENEAEKLLLAAEKKLMAIRDKRIRPGLDDKILCSWNALMLKGLTDAYKSFGDNKYLDLAKKNLEFSKSAFVKDDFRLDRNYKNETSTINAFLDDYSLLIDALISMYEVTFDESHLNLAKSLCEYVNEHFYDPATGFYFYTNDIDPPLIARKKEMADNVIPGSNSIMARNLYKLGLFFYDDDYLGRAESMILKMTPKILKSKQPGFYYNWCSLYYEMFVRPYEVAIVGDNCHALRAVMQKSYLPNVIYLGGKNEGSLELLKDKLQDGETFIYVCQNKVCKFPVDNVNAALKLLD